ncbi:hypothetical protein AVEN_126494-1 [Araneus ventricosus]|uniref:Endonuclease/exonuclease/phosphatase domain-containing protein n=1 Tax=Araneus ventricosus TaxID=182803 RepID=A0A4Y2X4I3_ARAVE|nr:hypothetical protein AVEN_126494-1 [Araneus ventricosus]
MENESDPPLKVYTSDEDDLFDMSTNYDDAPPPSSKSSEKWFSSFFSSGFFFAIKASIVSWNCRFIKHKPTNLKGVINDYQPVCIALQETQFKDEDQINITVFTKNNINGRELGGVALLAAHDSPYNPLNLYTQLQAIFASIQLHTFITICNLYLLPNYH